MTEPALKTGSSAAPLEGDWSHFWVKDEAWTLLRRPAFYLEPPAKGEVRRQLLRGRFAVATYSLRPDDRHPASAWLYVCTDKSYGIESLPAAMRRNVRRGADALRIEPLSNDQVLASALQAFCDTRARVGLSDGTPAEFQKRFRPEARLPGHVFLGAWKENELAAFLLIKEETDWCEIEGCFSRTSLLSLRPNDALMFHALRKYLTEGTRRAVGYGLSSIQTTSNEAGLHVFKTKVGFQAVPVYREFVVHPLLTPLVNRLSLSVLRRLLRLRPEHRMLKKAEGLLGRLLGEGPKELEGLDPAAAEIQAGAESGIAPSEQS